MVRRVLLVSSAAALLLLAAAARVPALASNSSSTTSVCRVDAHVSILPGLTMTPTSGVFGTFAYDGGRKVETPGTADCKGTFDGADVTGPGTVELDGTYGTGALRGVQGGDTCAEGSGSADVVLSVPTTQGTKILRGTIDIV